MPAGRPSKYTKDTLGKAKDYIRGGFEDNGEVVPTQEGLALALGITRKTLHEWKNHSDKPEFGDILDECNTRQTIMLMSGSLRGSMNANIAKLMLGKQGYNEKTIQELSGVDGEAIKTDNKWTVEVVKKDA